MRKCGYYILEMKNERCLVIVQVILLVINCMDSDFYIEMFLF